MYEAFIVLGKAKIKVGSKHGILRTQSAFKIDDNNISQSGLPSTDWYDQVFDSSDGLETNLAFWFSAETFLGSNSHSTGSSLTWYTCGGLKHISNRQKHRKERY